MRVCTFVCVFVHYAGRGANAVVDITSYYKKNEFRSASNYECYAGTFVAGVALKGTYAKVR